MKKRPVSLLLLLTIIGALFIGSSAEAVTTGQWYTKASDFKEVE